MHAHVPHSIKTMLMMNKFMLIMIIEMMIMMSKQVSQLLLP